jgi:hypothetical protein
MINVSGLIHALVCALGVIVVVAAFWRRPWVAALGVSVLCSKIWLVFRDADQRDWMHGLAVLLLGSLALLPQAAARE